MSSGEGGISLLRCAPGLSPVNSVAVPRRSIAWPSTGVFGQPFRPLQTYLHASPQAFYSAHPTTDATTGKTFNIGIGGSKGTIEVTRLSADGSFEKSATFTPPANLFWHDNTVTEEYVVAVTSPYVAPLKRIFGAILGFGQIGNAYKWDDTAKSEVSRIAGFFCLRFAAETHAPQFS